MLSTFSILRTDLSLPGSLGISKVLWTNGRSHQLLHLLRVLPAICRRQIKFYNTKFQVAMSSLASHKAVVGLCRIFGQKVAFVSHFGKTVLLQGWLGVHCKAFTIWRTLVFTMLCTIMCYLEVFTL